MENNNDLFELMTKMYAEQQKTNARLGSLETKFDKLETKVDTLETKVDKLYIKVEQDIEPKIQALFDGYSTHTEQLTRIEDEVARHDEVIIRRVK